MDTDRKAPEIESDTALRFLMLDHLRRVQESLEKLSESPMAKNQAE